MMKQPFHLAPKEFTTRAIQIDSDGTNILITKKTQTSTGLEQNHLQVKEFAVNEYTLKED